MGVAAMVALEQATQLLALQILVEVEVVLAGVLVL
jgi:hypothetical protein